MWVSKTNPLSSEIFTATETVSLISHHTFNIANIKLMNRTRPDFIVLKGK